MAAYLKTVRQVGNDPHAPLAFDVLTEDEARALDAREESETKVRRGAAEATRVAVARPNAGTLRSADLSGADPGDETEDGESARSTRRRGRERG